VPLIDANPIGMDRVLVEAQLRLHALDARPLVRALGDAISFDGYLTRLERRITSAALTGLAPALRWLRAHRPSADVPLVICHGDLHPRNVLVEGRRLTACSTGPTPSSPTRLRRRLHAQYPALRAARAGVDADAAALAGPGGPADPGVRYLTGYRRRRSITRERLAYYEVAAALRALVRRGRAGTARPARRRRAHSTALRSPPGWPPRLPRLRRGRDAAAVVIEVAMPWRIGVDIGGTFTDVVLADEASGAAAVVKVPTTPRDFAQGVVDGLEAAMREHGVAAADVGWLAHATTVVTNALLEARARAPRSSRRAAVVTCSSCGARRGPACTTCSRTRPRCWCRATCAWR